MPKVKEDQVRDEKVRMMKDKQKMWMEERAKSNELATYNGNTTRVRDSASCCKEAKTAKGTGLSTKSKTARNDKSDLLLWKTKETESPPDFIVRNGSKTSSRSSQSKSRSSSGRTVNKSQDMKTENWRTKVHQEHSDAGKHVPVNEAHRTSMQKHEKASPDLNSNLGQGIEKVPHGNARFTSTTNSEIPFDSNAVAIIDTTETESPMRRTNKYDKNVYEDTYLSSKSHDLNSAIHPTNGKSHGGIGNKNSTTFSTHLCPVCQKLMLSPRHMPMMIIPCGHSICHNCSSGQTICPSCQSQLSSMIENTTLKQIILEHKNLQEKLELEQKEQEARKYIDEYDSLKMRYNLLTNEAETIIEYMEDITKEMIHKKQTMKGIEQESESIRKKIEKLQENLVQCNNKREDCRNECNELEHVYDENKEKLNMLEGTIRQVKQSKERVKILITNFIPTLKLDEEDT